MKNKIDDLRNHLFAQLERLGDESLAGERLNEEIQRARAVKDISGSIIETAKAETDRLKVIGETGYQAGTALLAQVEQKALT